MARPRTDTSKLKPHDTGVERKKLLLADPHLLAFSGFCKHWEADEARENEDFVASTDGRNIFYGEKYMALPPEQKGFVFAHEHGHVIFRHVDRSLMLRLLRSSYHHGLFNMAADGVLNEGIVASNGGILKPPVDHPPIMMAFIHKAVQEAIDYTGATPPATYDPTAIKSQSVERVYDWLHWAFEETRRKRKEERDACPRAQLGGGDGDDGQPGDQPERQQAPDGASGDGADDGAAPAKGNPGGSRAGPSSSPPCTCNQCLGATGGGKGGRSKGAPQAGSPEDADAGDDGSLIVERYASGAKADIEEQREQLKRLLEEGKTLDEIIKDASDRVAEARAAIAQIISGIKQQGYGKGSMLLELEHDLPPPVVPWNNLLRREITRGLTTRLDDSYTRFGQTTTYALATGSRQVPYSPGTTIFTPAPKVLVVLDVSGSHLGQIARCFSEIRSIARKRRAIVDVMTFDHGVQEIITLRTEQDFRRILQRGIHGGGGTVIDEVWERIAKMPDPYRMAVVMTDGELYAGEKPRISVLWMVTPGGRTEFPYGKVISIPDYMTTEDARRAA